jgi:competence protein ComEC
VSDRQVLLWPVAAGLGALHPSALHPSALSPWVLLAALAGALAWRRPLAIALALVIATSVLAQRSLDGLDALEASTMAGEVVLITDPSPAAGGLRAEARVGGRRLELRARGSTVDDLAPRLAGDVLQVRGRVVPLEGSSSWLASRHVAGRLELLAVERWRPGDAPSRAANALRRTLEAGAAPLTERQRSLYTGLVYGDDRHQSLALTDAFLGAGLTHLVAVSGQNVAFCLALAGPVLRRMRLWPRWAATLGVIGLFGVMTRFEPSVTRAAAMAALAATVTTIGRPLARVRVIALAVTALLLVDPLLIRSAGFQLSVAAAAAIVVLAGPISAVLPGPAPLREALGVTVAAQVGVAPVLLATFGPVPVASLPANLLAVPVAGLVMVWGLTAGLVAGLLGPPVATVLHQPTALALDWLVLVASRTARAPLGELSTAGMLVVGGGLGSAVAARAWGRPRPWGRVGLGLAAASVAVAVVVASAPPGLRQAPVMGVVRWHAGGTDVVVLGDGGRRPASAAAVLEALRTSGVRSIDLLVVADARVAAGVVQAVGEGHAIGQVVVHGAVDVGALGVPAVRAPPEGASLVVGRLRVELVAVPGRLVVDARPSG